MNKTRLSLPEQIARLTYRENECQFSVSHVKSSLIDSSYLKVANQYYQTGVVLCQLLWFRGKPCRNGMSRNIIHWQLDYASNEYSLVEVKNTNKYSPFSYKPFLWGAGICNFNLQVLQIQHQVAKYSLKGNNMFHILRQVFLGKNFRWKIWSVELKIESVFGNLIWE